MNTEGFLDYKSCAEKLRLRVTRITDSGEKIDWTKIKEVIVNKDNVNVYQKVSLKKLRDDSLKKSVHILNIGSLKLAANKSKDLNAQDVHQLSAIKPFNKFLKTFPMRSFSLYS